jgi:hypothetical protein
VRTQALTYGACAGGERSWGTAEQDVDPARPWSRPLPALRQSRGRPLDRLQPLGSCGQDDEDEDMREMVFL